MNMDWDREPLLPPTNEVCEGYVFTGVRLSTPLPSACWDTHPPAQCMLGYGKQAGSTHPTGMHSCLLWCPSRSLFQSPSRALCMSHNCP